MNTIYINIPVKDKAAARDFYSKAGLKINEDFSNPISETVVLADNIMLLLVNEDSFKEAAKRDIAAPTTAEVVFALELESREVVDTLVNGAISAGGKEVDQAFEHDGMYTRIFRDPFGHQFNAFTFLG